MSDVGELVAGAWRDGVGPDDLVRIGELIVDDNDPLRAEVELFGAWCRLALHDRVTIPAAPEEAPAAVVHAAAVVVDATRSGEPATIDDAVARLAHALEALEDADPRAEAARAWADHALGEVALVVGERRVAAQRFGAVAAVGRPVALRIAAMLQLVGLAVERRDLESARSLAHKALILAQTRQRPLHAERARVLCGVVDYARGDLAAMRASLGDGGPLTRWLLATAEPTPRAMELLAGAVREAIEDEDPITYALCVLVGARRYLALGRVEDAQLTIDTAIAELEKVAPYLASALLEERREWDRS